MMAYADGDRLNFPARGHLPAPTSLSEHTRLRAEHNAALAIQSRAQELARLAMPHTSWTVRRNMRATALAVIADVQILLGMIEDEPLPEFLGELATISEVLP